MNGAAEGERKTLEMKTLKVHFKFSTIQTSFLHKTESKENSYKDLFNFI